MAMVDIEKREHGFTIFLEGHVGLADMRELYFQLMDELAGFEERFVLVLDARRFSTFSADAQAILEELLEDLPEHGLERVSVLGISTAFAALFCKIMVRTDLMPVYQFLDLAYEDDWEAELEHWLNEPFEQDVA